MSITAPEIMCEPISRPFSITAMVVSPRPLPCSSLCLLIIWRRRSAPANEAGPAPTNNTSTSNASRSMFPILPRHLLRLSRQRRHYLEQVTDNAVIGDFEDRSFGVFIDGHDGARAFHPDNVLDGAGDADGQV